VSGGELDLNATGGQSVPGNLTVNAGGTAKLLKASQINSAKNVTISGGSRGLGQAIVTGLLDAGYRVSTFSRRRTEFVEQMADNEDFFFSTADLAEAASVAAFLKSADARFGVPYGLINCAAVAPHGLLATMPEDSLQTMISINVEGTIRLTRRVVRKMLVSNGGGVILNISSISSMRGFKGLAAYAFTKGGIDAFTRALARELGQQKIRVNSIAPGYYAYFFWSWIIQVDVENVFDPARPDQKYEVWARIKFEGPRFPHAKPGDKNAIYVERLVLVNSE